MAYCTQSDILALLPYDDLLGLTDDDGLGEIDSAVVDQAIAAAEATINAYCQGHYTVPFASVPANILGLCVDLAIYNLYSRRSIIDLPEIRKERKKDALNYLTRVADGKVLLDAAQPAQAPSGQAVSLSGGDRLFSRTSMREL